MTHDHTIPYPHALTIIVPRIAPYHQIETLDLSITYLNFQYVNEYCWFEAAKAFSFRSLWSVDFSSLATLSPILPNIVSGCYTKTHPSLNITPLNWHYITHEGVIWRYPNTSHTFRKTINQTPKGQHIHIRIRLMRKTHMPLISS